MAIARARRGERHELLAGLRRCALDAGPRHHLPAHGVRGGPVLPHAGGHRERHALARLNAQIAQLTELLALEKTGKLGVEDEVAQLQANLLAAAERARPLSRASTKASAAAALRRRARSPSSPASSTPRSTVIGRALAQIEVLNQQIAALRRQLASLEDALDVSEKKDKESQTRIADLGQRLNMALAQRVQELSRYRSDFFGRLRAILGNRPDIRIVGDRFVFQSEVFFDSGQAVLTSRRAAPSLTRSRPRCSNWKSRFPARSPGCCGSTATPTCARPRHLGLQVQLGAVGRARDLGRAVSDQQGRLAAAPGRCRIRRVPADRSRAHRRSLQPQPPHRAEADGAVRSRRWRAFVRHRGLYSTRCHGMAVRVLLQSRDDWRLVLARLHQLRGLGDPKVLKSLGRSSKGRHYRG